MLPLNPTYIMIRNYTKTTIVHCIIVSHGEATYFNKSAKKSRSALIGWRHLYTGMTETRCDYQKFSLRFDVVIMPAILWLFCKQCSKHLICKARIYLYIRQYIYSLNLRPVIQYHPFTTRSEIITAAPPSYYSISTDDVYSILVKEKHVISQLVSVE